MNATGSLPDVVPYEVKPYGGWPGDFIWQAAEEVGHVGGRAPRCVAPIDLVLQISQIVTWAMLQVSGDVAALARMYPQLQAQIAFVSAATATTPGGLLDFGYYGDWNAAEGASTPFVENLNYVLACQRASVVAAAVGNVADAISFSAHAVLLTEAMVARFFNAEKGVWDNGGANAQVRFTIDGGYLR